MTVTSDNEQQEVEQQTEQSQEMHYKERAAGKNNGETDDSEELLTVMLSDASQLSLELNGLLWYPLRSEDVSVSMCMCVHSPIVKHTVCSHLCTSCEVIG